MEYQTRVPVVPPTATILPTTTPLPTTTSSNSPPPNPSTSTPTSDITGQMASYVRSSYGDGYRVVAQETNSSISGIPYTAIAAEKDEAYMSAFQWIIEDPLAVLWINEAKDDYDGDEGGEGGGGTDSRFLRNTHTTSRNVPETSIPFITTAKKTLGTLHLHHHHNHLSPH